MPDDFSPNVFWNRIPDENERWYGRFWRFVQAGSNRTLLGTVHAEEEEENQKAEQSGKRRKPLSKKVPGAWDQAAERYRWKQRAGAYDEAERQRIETKKQAYIDAILEEGFALKHERVKALNELALLLQQEVFDQAKRWLADVKQIGYGEEAERVDLTIFNDRLISEYRATFADLAAEMGERVKKKEITIKPMPKVYLDPSMEEDGIDSD